MAKSSEFLTVFTDRSVNVGVTSISNELPSATRDSKGLVGIHFLLKATVIAGTGAGSFLDAMVRAVENLTLRLSHDGIIYSVPGMALLARNNLLSFGTQTYIEPFTGVSGTFAVHLPLLLLDRRTPVPEDTILDLRRNHSLQVDITVGGTNRFYAIPGTSSVTYTLDMELETYDRPLSANNPQKWSQYIVHKQTVPVATGKILIEQAPSLWIKRLLWSITDSPDPWEGSTFTFSTPAVRRWSIEDIDGHVGLKNSPDKLLSVRSIADYAVYPFGVRVHDYIARSGSNMDATSANRTGFALTWDTITAPPAHFVHLLIDGLKLLT